MQHVHAAVETFLNSSLCAAIAAGSDSGTNQALSLQASPQSERPPLAPESVWESCKECPNPRESCYSEQSEHERAGKRAVAFLLPAELPAFWGPTISPPATALLPFPKWCFPASSWKRVSTGHEHTQGFKQESQNADPNPETHLATKHERTEWETEGSPWAGSPRRERGQGSPEGSGSGRAGSCAPAQLLPGSQLGALTDVLHSKFTFAFLLFWTGPKLQAPGCLIQHVQKDAKRGMCRKLFPSMDQFNTQTVSSAGSH